MSEAIFAQRLDIEVMYPMLSDFGSDHGGYAFSAISPMEALAVDALIAYEFMPLNEHLLVLAGRSGYPQRSIAHPRTHHYADVRPILFRRYVAEWKAQRGPTSSITAMAMSLPYQLIIGMGAPVVPLILAQLESEGDQPDMWFWALKALTNTDPVKVEDRGDMVAMARAWIDWGRSNSVS